jgi:6-hydroxynicotinate reductase
VAPLEFTMARDDYLALGGHAPAIRNLDDILRAGGEYSTAGRRVPGSAA